MALRGAFWKGRGRGLVLLLPGRVEFVEKYALPAAELVARGFSVASLDWRGQGLSERLCREPLKGHVADFGDYHRDLAALLAHPLVAAEEGPRVLLAHSMGGTIALGALLRERLSVQVAIVSAPMLGIVFSPRERLLARFLLPLARLPGMGCLWPPVRGAAEPYAFSGFEGNCLTGDRELFEWGVEMLRKDPRLALGLPTMGWLAAARREMRWILDHARPVVPGLCLLGSDERVVDAAAVRRGAEGLGFALVTISGARHELLFAAPPERREVWNALDRFLMAQGL